MKYVKMKRDAEIADVAEIEIEIWQAAGFEVIDALQAETETPTEAKPVKRGRPRKAD
jgi:hypothetical protein